ncbi:MAG: hypothetical protein H3C62_09845 [Gemmatimonadaceae bacterium]|nr:hypothetical protein [Gemmatimonadaceae bacterium]
MSVKTWSAYAGVSRTKLHHAIVRAGYTPSHLLDAIRSLHALGPALVERRSTCHDRREWSAMRTARRIVLRTLGLTPPIVAAAASEGADAVRALVTDRLRRHFEPDAGSVRHALPPALALRT